MKERVVHMFLEMKKISLGQLCDTNVTIIFTKEKLRFFDNDNHDATVMEGLHSSLDGKWHLYINGTSSPNQHNSYQVNSVHRIKEKEDIVNFYPMTCGILHHLLG